MALFELVNNWKGLLTLTVSTLLTIGALFTVRSVRVRKRSLHSSPVAHGHDAVASSGTNSPVAHGTRATATSGPNSPVVHGNVEALTLVSAPTAERVTKAVRRAVRPGDETKLGPAALFVQFLLGVVFLTPSGAEVGTLAAMPLPFGLTLIAAKGAAENFAVSEEEENSFDAASRVLAGVVYFAVTAFMAWGLWRTLDGLQFLPRSAHNFLPSIKQAIAGFGPGNVLWALERLAVAASILLAAFGLASIMVWQTKAAFSHMSAGLGVGHAIRFAALVAIAFLVLLIAACGGLWCFARMDLGQFWQLLVYIVYRVFLVDLTTI